MSIEHPDHDQGERLGELPVERRIYRRENYGQRPVPPGPPGMVREVPGLRQDVPPVPTPPVLPRPLDVRRSQSAFAESQSLPSGLPSSDFVVQTTFDARPINGVDFQIQRAIAIEPLDDPPVASGTNFFEVPRGRVAIIRRIQFQASEIIAQEPLDSSFNNDPFNVELTQPLFVGITVAGVVPFGYDAIFRQAWDEPTYLILGPGERLELFVSQSFAYSGTLPAGYAPTVFFNIYGNLLQTRGRERAYEPANQYTTGDRLR